MNSLIGTKEASKRLNISVRRVQTLIASGRLPAEKIGNSFAIKPTDLQLITGRKSGRPINGKQPREKKWDEILDKVMGKHNFGPPDLASNKKYLEGLGRD